MDMIPYDSNYQHLKTPSDHVSFEFQSAELSSLITPGVPSFGMTDQFQLRTPDIPTSSSENHSMQPRLAELPYRQSPQPIPPTSTLFLPYYGPSRPSPKRTKRKRARSPESVQDQERSVASHLASSIGAPQ